MLVEVGFELLEVSIDSLLACLLDVLGCKLHALPLLQLEHVLQMSVQLVAHVHVQVLTRYFL